MEPGVPPTWRPAFADPRRGSPLQILILPALLTIPLVALTVLAGVSGALDLFWTGVFWESLFWGGVVLYFAGLLFGRRMRAAPV